MKFIAVILLCFFGWFSSTPFKYVETTQQTSMGGRQESGKSIYYEIKLVAKHSSTKLNFKKLWIGADEVEIHLRGADGGFLKDNSFSKKDTITLIAYKRFLPNKGGILVYDKMDGAKVVPKEYQGVALLAYDFKGKTKYLEIKEIRKLPNVNLP
jgi:hypothetical protein